MNPVMVKDLRGRMRGSRAFWVLTGYLGLMTLVTLSIYTLVLSAGGPSGGLNQYQIVGKTVFASVFFFELLTITFLAPGLTSGAIAAERELQTFDLLRVTLLPARALILGKFFAALLFIFLLLFTALPLSILSFVIGGVTPAEIVIAFLLLVVTAAGFSAIGILFSTLTSRTLVGTILSYGLILLLVFGVPLLALLGVGAFGINLGIIQGTPDLRTEMTLVRIGWVLASLNPPASAILSETMYLTNANLVLSSVPLSNQTTLTLISPWIFSTAFYILLTVLLLWLSVRRTRRTEN